MNRRDFTRLTAATTALSFLPELNAQPQAASSFRFSVMLWALGKYGDFDKLIELVAQAGYTGIELVHEYQKWTDTDIVRVNARLRELNLTIDSIAGVRTGFADPNSTEALISEMKSAIEYAKKLNCPQIILTSGNRFDIPNQHAVCVENLQRLIELAAKEGEQIVIEPIDLLENPTMYLTSVTEAFDIVRTIGSPHLRVLYDLYHEQRQAGNLLEKLEKNIDLVALIHVADVPGRHEPGTGEIRYDAIYRKLAELKYTGYIAMEFFPTGDLVQTFRTAREQAIRAVRS